MLSDSLTEIVETVAYEDTEQIDGGHLDEAALSFSECFQKYYLCFKTQQRVGLQFIDKFELSTKHQSTTELPDYNVPYCVRFTAGPNTREEHH